MGLIATNLSSGFRKKVRFQPACSATGTSYKIEILLVANFDMVLSKKAKNKGADQTARMRRLVCAFDVRKLPKIDFLASRPTCVLHCHCMVMGVVVYPHFPSRAEKS